MQQTKSVMFFGHVNVGKSTTLGHLLSSMGYISEHEMEKLSNDAKLNGKDKSKFAYVADSDISEQRSGNTHERVRIEHVFGDTKYIFYDTPGHKHLVAEFISAVNEIPTTAVLLIPAKYKDYLNTVDSGVIKEYTRICKCIGIKNLVVAVNKMDSIDWSDEWHKVRDHMREVLTAIRYNDVTFVPCSGYTLEGILKRSAKYPDDPSLIETFQLDTKIMPLCSTFGKPELVAEVHDLINARIHVNDPTRILINDYLTSCKASKDEIFRHISSLMGVQRTRCCALVNVFDTVLITPDWQCIVHFTGLPVTCTVKALWSADKKYYSQETMPPKDELKPLRTFNKKDCVYMALEFAEPVNIFTGARLIMRFKEDTIAGALVRGK